MEIYDISYHVFSFCSYQTLLRCMRVGNFTKTHKILELFPKSFKIRGSIVDYYFLRIGLLIVVSFYHDSTNETNRICINLVDCFGQIHENSFDCFFSNEKKCFATFFENFKQTKLFICVESNYEKTNVQIDLDTLICRVIPTLDSCARMLNKTKLIKYDEPSNQAVNFVYQTGFKHPQVSCHKQTQSKSLQISLNFDDKLIFDKHDIIYDAGGKIIFRYLIRGVTHFVTIEKNFNQILVTNYKSFCCQQKTDFFMLYCKFTKTIRLLRIQNIENKRNIRFSFFDRWY